MFSAKITQLVFFLTLVLEASKILCSYPSELPTFELSLTSLEVFNEPEFPKDVKLIPLKKEVIQRGQIRYTLGHRESNDTQLKKSQSSVTPAEGRINLQMHLKYPVNATFVKIDVKQGTSDDGEAFAISSGNDGYDLQQGVDIFVVARNVSEFGHKTSIYGFIDKNRLLDF